MESLINVGRAAEILGVTVGSIYDMVHSGKLNHYRIGTGRGSIRFRESDLEDYLADCFKAARSPDAIEQPKTRRRGTLLRGLRFLSDCV